MKLLFVVCCITAFIGIALLVGCSDDSSTDACMVCHSETTTEGKQILGAQAGYDNSGHWLGPRMLLPYNTASGHLYVFHGSNAPYANATFHGTACHQCHTHEGYVEYVTTGANATAVDETPAPPGCFSCHAPHEDGNFGLRTTAAVALADGTTTFDKGSGNLCASCHLAGDTASDEIGSADFTDKGVGGYNPSDMISSHFGPHHGPQADYMMGVNSAISAYGTYVGQSVHYNTSVDSCVTCHHYQPDERMAGNLEWGGHGFYLTSEVHGAPKDLIANCTSVCHDDDKFKDDSTVYGTAEGFLYMNRNAASDWDGKNGTERIFEEIQGMRDTLIDYFGTSSNFLEVTYTWNAGTQTFDASYAAGGTVDDGDGPIVDAVDDTADPDTGVNGHEWGQSWVFGGAEMSQFQSEAFWNLRYFIEDKSIGIHNPDFAAQLLWDAITHLNANESAGLTIGLTRPPN